MVDCYVWCWNKPASLESHGRRALWNLFPNSRASWYEYTLIPDSWFLIHFDSAWNLKQEHGLIFGSHTTPTAVLPFSWRGIRTLNCSCVSWVMVRARFMAGEGVPRNVLMLPFRTLSGNILSSAVTTLDIGESKHAVTIAGWALNNSRILMGSGLWSGFFLQHSVSKVCLKNRISYIVSDQDCESNICYIPNQWIVFFTHSDWLLKLGLFTSRIFLDFARKFPLISQKKRNHWVLHIYSFGIYWNNYSP